MSIINNGLLLAAEAAAAPVTGISRSLRFNSADSAHLSRTPASAGNRKTWTWAGWVKRSKLGEFVRLFNNTASGANAAIQFMDSDKLRLFDAGIGLDLQTTQVFRDASAWYHFVIALDTTQATSSNRAKLYVNGSQITTFSTSTYPSQNTDGAINNNVAHQIGTLGASSEFFNGLLADIHFIDGQALDPSSFGEFDANNVWQPKAYTGSYGTNGFHLTFSDNSGTTSTTLGKDAAGSNNWTPNNFSVASGSGNDSLVDSPTSFGTDTGAGGEVRGNYCTLNPIAGKLAASPTAATPFNGNLETSYDRISSGTPWVVGTIAIPASGKWYWEYTITAASSSQPATSFGVISTDSNAANNFDGGGQTFRAIYNFNGNDYKEGGTYTTYASAAAVNDVIGIAVDMNAGSIYFHKNGSWANGSGSYNQAFSGAAAAFTDLISAGKTWVPLIGANGGNSGTTVANFGQRPFAYTAPSGFKALCTANLPTPTIANGATAMDVKLYTGNGSTQTISGLNFSPSLVWYKSRNNVGNHALFDVVRGATKRLVSNDTAAEDTRSGVTSFNSDGWTEGSFDNQSGYTYVGWAFNGGTSTVTNTQGSITSQVRANASAGFSIVTYTGTGSAATVGHGLGVAPSLVLVKIRSQTGNWQGYHASLGKNYTIKLNTTEAQENIADYWGAGGVTSSVVGLIGGGYTTNVSGATHVAYCFAPVAGYTVGSSYTGNGSADGPFVFTNMRPRWILIKRTDSTGNWTIIDTAREGYNVDNDPLFPNLADAEGTTDLADILSNGFKLRSTDASVNASGGTYIYYAIGENAFSLARAR